MDSNVQEESLRYGIVKLFSRYVMTDEEKGRYQRVDVVNQIIEFETSLDRTLKDVLTAIDTAEQLGLGSIELSRLSALTEAYSRELAGLNNDIKSIRQEHVSKVLAGHSLVTDSLCKFDVSGYQFTAVPVSMKVNYIVSDLFCYSDIANINMPLTDVIITGVKKPRKGQMPSHLCVELWKNHEDERN